MAVTKKTPPEINASSMADIAFLLLVFFLVTTTMDSPLGISRLLPPPQDINVTPPKFLERNVFTVLANKNDQLLVEGELMDISQLKNAAKEFIANPNNRESLPEKKLITKALCQEKMAAAKSSDAADAANTYKKWKKKLAAAEAIGQYWESKQVISLQNDRGTSYNLYIQVQNELAAAYHELRDELAKEKFGKPYDNLPEDKQKIVKTVLPQKISEAEPVNYGGK